MAASPVPTLVVVGDDASFCYLLERYAKKSDYRAVSVHSHEDALSTTLRESPVAVILELDLPKGRGWKAYHALKHHPETCEIPVILCSWSDETERGLDEGGTVHLRKPILYDDFLEVLLAMALT